MNEEYLYEDEYYDPNYLDQQNESFQMDEEQLIDQTYIFEAPQRNEPILNPVKIADSGFEFLLNQGDWSQVEQVFSQDRSSQYYFRLGKIYNYISNIIQITLNQDDLLIEYLQNLIQACKLFIEQIYLSQHSILSELNDQQSLVSIQVDKNLISILLIMLMRNPSNLTQEQAQLRPYLWRFLYFLCTSPVPFITTMKSHEIQNFILQRLEQIFLQDVTPQFESQQLDIIGYIYLCDPIRHVTSMKSMKGIEQIINIYKSLLENEDKSQKTSIQVSILNILRLFVLLAENEQIKTEFINQDLHMTLYKAIKFSTLVFSKHHTLKVWSQEPLIRKAMITLICRILSQTKVDQRLAQILLDDFLYLIQNINSKSFDFEFLYSVILPILNTESQQLASICIHQQIPIEKIPVQLAYYRDFFKQNIQCQGLALTLRLQSDLLSFDQREAFGQLFNKKMNTISIKKQKIRISLQKQEKQQIEQDWLQEIYNLNDFFENQCELFTDQIQQEKSLQQEVQVQKLEQEQQQLQQQSEPLVEQNEPLLNEVAGRWSLLYNFSMHKPEISYKILHQALEKRSNLLFIFDLMCAYTNCKLVVFVEGACAPGAEQIGVKQKPPSFLVQQKLPQAKSTARSFYGLFCGSSNFITIEAHSQKNQPFLMLDLQPGGLNLAYQNEIVAYINFGNVQMSKFNFPFSALTEKTDQTDLAQAALSSEEVFPLALEIWNFNPQSSTLQDDTLESQLSQFSTSSIQEILSEFTSQMRLEPVFSVSNDINLNQLNLELSQQTQKIVKLKTKLQTQQDLTLKQISAQNKDGVIDLYTYEEIGKIHIPQLIKLEKPLLKYFQLEIHGMVKIAKLLRESLLQIKDDWSQSVQEFFNDFLDLIEIQGFVEELMGQEGFLQSMISIVVNRQNSNLGDLFHSGMFQLYNALFTFLSSNKVGRTQYEEVFNKLLWLLLKRAIDYTGTLYQNISLDDILKVNTEKKDDDQLRNLFKTTSKSVSYSNSKGKPKGIGYGDINYNANQFSVLQQQQQQNNSQNQKQKTMTSLKDSFSSCKYQEDILGVILQSFAILFENITISEKTRQNISKTLIFTLLKTLFFRQNISDLTYKDKVIIPAFKFIKAISSHEELLDLFTSIGVDVSQTLNEQQIQQFEGNSLYRMLEILKDQAQIYMVTFKENQEKQKLIPEYLSTMEYLEQRLIAAEFLSISYQQDQPKEESKQPDIQTSGLNLHQFYSVLMKPIAVSKITGLKQDRDWLAKMDSYFKQCASSPPINKMNRLVQELSDLAHALPLESTNSIFVRFDSDRMDVMRCIIFGAEGTPYAHGGFQYELLFMDDYPNRPPKVLLTTTGHGKFRFNPNLYSCGKVCLSLLGTWGDNWIANVSTILQILVSIQSMVMTEYVMFNEPGWEGLMGSKDGEIKNLGYCNLVRLNNIRYAMIEQLQNPPLGFEDIIKKSFYLRKDLICKEIESWISKADEPANYSSTQNTSNYQNQPEQYKQDLIKLYDELKIELEKLKLQLGTNFQFNNQDNAVKRKIKLTYKPPITQYKQKFFDELIKKYQPPQSLNINDVDMTYNKQVEQKPFDPQDVNVQNLMSRYIGVLGVDAVQKQSEAQVILLGLSSLGIEIAKNVILSGVKRLTIWDETICEPRDLCGQFYIWNTDIGQSRARASIPKLQHLNPYVLVDFLEGKDIFELLKSCIIQYSVLVISDFSIKTDQIVELGRLCRLHKVNVILAQSNGIYSRIVTDFGDEFQVSDRDGEAPNELNIESISLNGEVILFNKQRHSLQDGDTVLFQEIIEQGDQAQSLNNTIFKISNVKRNSFNIGNIERDYKKYIKNGLVYQQKRKALFTFIPLEQVLFRQNQFAENMSILFDPLDEAKRDLIQALFNCWGKFQSNNISWNIQEALRFFAYFKHTKCFDNETLIKYNEELIPRILLFALITGGIVPAIDAFIGGMVAQEVLKSITHKYSPIKQVFIHQIEELLPITIKELNQSFQFNIVSQEVQVIDTSLFQQFLRVCEPRYQPLQIIYGADLLKRIRDSKIFMIGAGAIGCELLKNFAMCGLGTQNNGCIYLTDPDVIENSNLSRQFLFREKHIRKPKAVTAAAAAKQMNPDIQVVARLDRVCPETQNIYSYDFFNELDCIANALDNVQARLYVDYRCVESNKPLVESGTLGPKGHVQVILPNLTESYGSRRDPEEDNDIPYCTLKMFPESALHCLEWARDKFEQYFVRKPQAVSQVIQASQSQNPKITLSSLQQQTLELALRCLNKIPITFEDCIRLGRLKYERLFKWAIQSLLVAYPIDSVDGSGKLFWSAPKRPPHQLNFNEQGTWAVQFVYDFAILTAQAYDIQIPEIKNPLEEISKYVQSVQVPEFKINADKLQQMKQQVESNKQKPQQMEEEKQLKPLNQIIEELIIVVKQRLLKNKKLPQPQSFEKDDDDNHHVSFIASATNARATNYGIQKVEWLWCKLKAGRIVPAMATTTSCISALQTIEILKILSKKQLQEYKNSFMNLAIPNFMQSEPGSCEQIQINPTLSINIWSKHIIKLNQITLPLILFIEKIEKDLQCKVNSLKQGAKPIYIVSMLPTDLQTKEQILLNPIWKVLDINTNQIDLDVTLNINQKDIIGPKIRVITSQ